MTKNLITLIFLFFSSQLFANENFPVGARQAGMANTAVMFPCLWSVSHNQGGLGYLNDLSIGLHHENRYLLKELSVSSLAIACPTNTGTLAGSVQYFGYSKYHEYKIGLAYGKAFGKKLSVGIQLDYFNRYIAEGYGNKNAVTFEMGILSKPIDNLYIGAHVFNPIYAKMGEEKYDAIPFSYRFGMGYAFADKVLIGIENEKQSGYPSVFKMGIEYKIIDQLYLRTGIMAKPVINTFGIGYNFKKAAVDLAFTYDKVLNLTPHFSFRYNVVKLKN